MAGSAASGLLGRQLKQMQNDKDIPGISCGLVGNNIFEWQVVLMISDDCQFYGGISMIQAGVLEKSMGYITHENNRRSLSRPSYFPA